MKIKIVNNDTIYEGYEIDTVELNKIATHKCTGLIYLMNLIDDESHITYMWFKDDDADINYFVKIKNNS